MPKRISILLFTMAFAIITLFAATEVTAEDECDPYLQCIVAAQQNKKTTYFYTIKPKITADGNLLVPCGDTTYPCPAGFSSGQALAAKYEITSDDDPGLSKISEILMSFPARCGKYLEVVAVTDPQGGSSGIAFHEPCAGIGPYPLDCTKSAVEINFDATDGFVLYFKNIESIPDNGSISTDIINIALGVGSGTFPCAGLLGPAIVEECAPPTPELASTGDSVETTDCIGNKWRLDLTFDQDGNVVKAEKFKNENSQGLVQGKAIGQIEIQLPNGTTEKFKQHLDGMVTKTGDCSTCAYWYRGVYYDFCD